MFDLSSSELRLLKRLDSPRKIQDFLETIPINFEPNGDTCRSPRRVMRDRVAHCIEGAMFAALALRVHGERPLVMHLASAAHDFDHVVTVFQKYGHWGAMSKTNHAVLRYREPVYRTIRELALSYFHEYFDAKGKKTLRAFSRPVNLARFDTGDWMTTEEDVWEIPNYLADVKHLPIVDRRQLASLRRADPTERKAGEITQWKN